MPTDSSASSLNVAALTHYSLPSEAAESEDKPHPQQSQPPPQSPSPSFPPSAPPYTQAPTHASFLAEHSHPVRFTRAALKHPSCSGMEASDTTSTSAGAAHEQRLQGDVAAASQGAKTAIASRPTFLQAVQRKLFPNVKPPIELDHMRLNTYREDVVATSDSQGGSATLKYALTSSRTVANLLLEAVETGRAPSFPDGQDGANYSGVYTSPDAVGFGSQVKGANLEQFRQGLNQLAKDPASVLQSSTSDYFDKPKAKTSAGGTGISPKAFLSLYRFAQFYAEVELRVADGTLSPKSRQLIDAVLLPPPHPGSDQRKLSTTPVVSRVRVATASTSPTGVALTGAFLVTDRDPFSPMTAGVLYSPELGIHAFDSLLEFRNLFLREGPMRKALLNTVSDRDRASVTNTDGFSLLAHELKEDVFDYSVQSQLNRQQDDIAYQFERAKKAGITSLDELEVISRHASEPLQASFDADRIEGRRLAAWVEHHRPSWWKNASAEERAQLDQLQRDANTKAEVFHGLMQQKVPSLNEYATWQIKRALQAKYPDADIDPNRILVQSDAINPTRVPNKCVSLTQFVLDNVKSKLDLIVNAAINPHWSASFADRHGKNITLLQPELRALARNLNVGQSYQDFLNARMLSAAGNDLRHAWKDSYIATMRADAEAARLSGALNENSYNRIKSLLDRPDGHNRLQLSYLKIGGSEGSTFNFSPPNNYREGASLVGPLLMAAKDAKPQDPVDLYTPNTPDGTTFQPYTSMKVLNADRRFRQDEWKTYFKLHVSENMKAYLDKQFARGYSIFNRAKVSGASFHNVLDKLYDADVRKMVASTQVLSKSNSQLNKETAVDLFLFAMDTATLAASVAVPGSAAIKSLARLLNPQRAMASLARLPNLAAIVQQGARRPMMSFANAIPKRAAATSALHDIAAANRMTVIDFEGKPYLAPKVPDQPDGHYLLRMISPLNDGEIVSSTIIAKPEIRNGMEIWRRRSVRGGSPPGLEWNADWDAAVSNYLGMPSSSSPRNYAPPDLTPQQIIARSTISNINDPVEVRNKIAILGTDASAWIAKYKWLSNSERRPVPQLPPSPTGPAIIDGVYGISKGMVVGELHNAYAAKQFLVDNMQRLKQKGVGTLYAEGLFREQYGSDLDIFNNTGHITPPLDQKLTSMSNYPPMDPNSPYSMKRLFESAHSNGIKIEALDNFASTTGSDIAIHNEQMAHASSTDFSYYRQLLFSRIAPNIIKYNQSITGNKPWVALAGYAHANGLPPSSPGAPGYASGVPGLAPLTDSISVVVLPTGESPIDALVGDIHLNIPPPP